MLREEYSSARLSDTQSVALMVDYLVAMSVEKSERQKAVRYVALSVAKKDGYRTACLLSDLGSLRIIKQ